jgi:hypothetical protein
VNGEGTQRNLRKGTKRREFYWGTVYTNKTFPHRLVVRMGGMPMFIKWTNVERCVIIELNGTSGSCLTGNRDGLRSTQSQELDSFLAELGADSTSALRNRTPVYHKFGKKRMMIKIKREEVASQTAAYATVPKAVKSDEDEGSVVAVDPQPFSGTVVGSEDGTILSHRSDPDEVQFTVKNTTGMQVPDWFIPGEGFSSYSMKLATVWSKLMSKMHMLFGRNEEFSVGFVLDDSSEAEHERCPELGIVYYVNPAVVVEQTLSRSRSLKKRWKFNSAGYNTLLALAVHEFVHGMGYRWHDEAYAGKLTDVTAIVLANRKAFNECFR